MKSSLFILFLIVGFICMGQVPDTETFTLQDVVDVVNPTTDDLVDCFSDADAGSFDPAYTGYPANSLLRFRNYGAVLFPIYEDRGNMAASGTADVDVPYMPTVNENDILFIQVWDSDEDDIGTPLGWTLIFREKNIGVSHIYFWRRATGSESGSVTVISNSADGTGIYGVMTRYSNCITSGIPFEDKTLVDILTRNTLSIPEMASTDILRLAVGIICINNNPNIEDSFSDYTESYSAVSVLGNDCILLGAYQRISSARTVPYDRLFLPGLEIVGSIGILLIPR